MVVMLARIESPRGGRLDFFHATEHLAAAIAAIHGDGTFATRHKFEFLRERLLTEDKGAEAVIDALAYLRRKHPRLTKVASVLAHFRKNRQRMQYAQWKRGIGMLVPSEASCFRGAGSL
jgi:NAD(P)-dependent dehydrogenase (short-subunit alcohol dehydrogenase family)